MGCIWHLQLIKHFQNLYISSVSNDFIFWTLGKVLKGIAGLANREEFIRKVGGMGACGVDPMTSEPLCLAGKGVEGTREPWGLERCLQKPVILRSLG